jgi:hypothetical protein
MRGNESIFSLWSNDAEQSATAFGPPWKSQWYYKM